MALSTVNPTTTPAWHKLQQHFDQIKENVIVDSFASQPDRLAELSRHWDEFFVDFSKNRMNAKTLELLLELAQQTGLEKAIQQQFGAERINATENREVLHTALRAPRDAEVFVDGQNIIPEIHDVKSRIKVFSDNIISGDFTGYTGKPFTDIVNVGIGGSDLGPSMVVEALHYYRNHLNVHYVSNIDGDYIQDLLNRLNPETTLFVVVSKTFGTEETIINAKRMRTWFLEYGTCQDIQKHFVGVSANPQAALEFGICDSYFFPIWEWVGGRFSLWSAVGLTISLTVGYDHFDDLLSGGHAMDMHFRETELIDNIPVILGLIGIWYTNFYKTQTEAVICYSEYLNLFSKYLQQGVMESNGKSVSRDGEPINYETANVVWGQPGTNAQHAFFQLFHQGTQLIPSDFIAFGESLHGNKAHQDFLIASFIAQSEALLTGKKEDVVRQEMRSKKCSNEEIERLVPFKLFEGNKPSTSLFIQKLTPKNLGKLIALYEHKIFVQGVIWNIFSYDQYGVELGKQLVKTVLGEIEGVSEIHNHDVSTQNLIQLYKKLTK